MLCVQSGFPKSWYCVLGSHEDCRGRWYDQPGDTWKSNCSRPCWRCDWEKHLLATWTWSDRLRGRCYVPGEEIWSFLQLVPNKKYPVSSCRREDLDCWTLTLTSLFSRCWIRQPVWGRGESTRAGPEVINSAAKPLSTPPLCELSFSEEINHKRLWSRWNCCHLVACEGTYSKTI